MKTLRDFERYCLNNCQNCLETYNESYNPKNDDEPDWQSSMYEFNDDFFVRVTEWYKNDNNNEIIYDIDIAEDGELDTLRIDSMSYDFSVLKEFTMKIIENSNKPIYTRTFEMMFDFEMGMGRMLYDYKR